MRRHLLLISLIALCLGCSDDAPSTPIPTADADVIERDGGGTDVGPTDVLDDTPSDASEGDATVEPDTTEDAEPDVADTDVAPDAEPDAAPDAETDVPPDADADADAMPDVDEDVAPDVEPDVAPDVAPDADVEPDADDVEPDVPVEPRELSVLLIAPAAESPAAIAAALGSAVDAHPDFELTESRAIAYDDEGLLGFAYTWTGRDARLAPLAEDWDIVVLMDSEPMPYWSAGAHFEGARVLAELAIEGGAQPVLATNGTGDIFAGRTYRVANGLGIPVLPIQDVRAEAGAAASQVPLVAAATLMHELTEVVGGAPSGTDVGTWEGMLAAAATVRSDDTPRYLEPWEGAVRIDDLPLPETYNFMIAGTSSERGYRTQMNRLLEREGIARSSVNLGQCTMYRSVDEACATLAQPHFGEREYMSLYARSFDIDSSVLRELGGGAIQAQIYDRHWDATDNDGINALDQIEDRTLWVPGVASDQDLAWLPQHINFARLKYEMPTANLLSDGTHATTAVQDGLAAMSFVSTTGLSPSTEGVSEESAIAIRNGEQVIRQLSALSTTGEFVPDVPGARPSLRLE